MNRTNATGSSGRVKILAGISALLLLTLFAQPADGAIAEYQRYR